MNVDSSNTTLTFAAPSLPGDVFNDTVVVMVTAMNIFGIGPPSNLSNLTTAEIYGKSFLLAININIMDNDSGS